MPKPIIIRGSQLTALGVGFQSIFQKALSAATPLYPQIATVVNSSTKSEDYGWLNDMPGMREWIGDRKVRELSASGYNIRNKKWEATLKVDRDDIEDDNLGIYSTKMEVLGDAAGRHPDELTFGLLNTGFNSLCYDGQNFFDTDHPILDEAGEETTFANTDGGGAAAWFLMATGGVLKPMIYQLRKAPVFVSKDQLTDDGVFWNNEFYYGADARYNVGFGLPQLCWGSQQTLDTDHFNTAYAALLGMPRDGGGKIAPTSFTLVVGPSNRASGENVVGAAFLAGGATNVNYNKAKLLVAPWLT